MSYDFNQNQFNGFKNIFGDDNIKFDHMNVHNHMHGGQRHTGDRVTTPDFVIRHQFDSNGGILGGMPEIDPKFK